VEKTHSRRTPKQARSQERYDKILQTASNLFKDKGFDGTTTNEIARWADISIGSLYQYFNNKEAIVAALTDRYVETLKEVTADIVATDTGDLPTATAVDRLLDPIVKFHLTHPEFRRLWLGAEVSEELKASMRAMDEEVLGRVREALEELVPDIPDKQAVMIVATIELTVKTLLGLLGRFDDPAFKAKAATETKRMLVAYVQEVVREHP
jgi:AcrR family transcriptional regulator